MATSELVTDYADFITNRWANGDTISPVTDALFDKVTTLVNACTTTPVLDLPAPLDYYGTVDTTVHAQLATFLAVDPDSYYDLYWDQPGSAGRGLSEGVAQFEEELYDKWVDFEGAGGDTVAIAEAADAMVDLGLEELHNKLFPAAQLRFLPSNMVFTSGFQRFVLDQYENLDNAVNKFSADARLSQLDKGATRTIELIKVAAERAAAKDALNADLMMKKTTLVAQLEELQTKLTASVNQGHLHDVINLAKYDYMYDTAILRWPLDNEKYRMEAMAALHGASPSTRSSSVEGFSAMTDFEKGVNIAGAAVSLAAGIGSFAKNLGLFD